MTTRHPPKTERKISYLPAPQTFLSDAGEWEMGPAQLRAIRMDMGINMVAMAHILEAETGARISRDKYRTWERPRREGEWSLVPAYAAQATEKVYDAFCRFVSTLVESWEAGSALVLIHRNDMFDEAGLPLPPGVSVENYNQAVGKAWARIREQGHKPELVYFSTDLSPEVIPRTKSTSVHERQEVVQDAGPYKVGSELLPAPAQPKSFVNWSNSPTRPHDE